MVYLRMDNKNRYLVTSALPYANGYIHLGHIAGAYLPADIYVRYRRLKNDDIIFICGSDEHGTAIEISAMKEKTTPKKIIDRYHFSNKNAFKDLGIEFDIYSRTSNEIHHKTAKDFFLNLYNKGLLNEKSEMQLYSEKEKRFLADRYVIGTCPICKYEEAKGDQCENCGSNLSPAELIEPRSIISGDKLALKETKNYFLQLEKLQSKLEIWIGSKTNWKSNVKNYCDGWFKTGLRDRAITRDLDWGVKVPVEGSEGKVIYVWFEAPIGYISATKELFIEKGIPEKWSEYWCNEDTQLIHFIGKDNIIFHAIVFPAMLMSHGDFILPENVPANEFLNLEGSKLSKSKGHGILVKDIVKEFNPDLIRYTITSNLPENKDSDFNWDDFQIKNNNELAAILGNFVNRTIVFVKNKYNNKIPAVENEVSIEVREYLFKQKEIVSECFDNFRFRDGLNEIMNVARFANKYFNDNEPWKAIKENPEKCGHIIRDCLELCFQISIFINPVLPNTSEKILKILRTDKKNLEWNKIGELILTSGEEIGEAEILFPQIDLKEEKMENEIKVEIADEITIDDFKKINLRTAKVLECVNVEKSKKLLKLKIKIGNKEKQIVAGIAEHYKAEDLIGKLIVIVDNLRKTRLMGNESHGMLLAAKSDGKLCLLTTDKEINDGADIN
jgi:methionyl-tRNA synthetase